MLSKTELWPAKDRLKDADRHLAYVKGSIRHIKSVEDKQIVNDLVGAIEAQRKAVEQMLQVLDAVARHDFCSIRLQELQGPEAKTVDRKEARKRRVRGDSPDPAQAVFPESEEQELVTSEQSAD
jgi:predicted negative regulator of RcsB-dependent stress response